MEKGINMTIKVSKDVLEKMFQGDESHPNFISFEEEKDTRNTQKNESE